MKAIGYVRVSTSKQAIDGLSIEAQQEKIKKWAEYHNHELAHIFIDQGISGKKIINRPMLQEAINHLEKDVIFVFYSLSRVSRNTIDTLTIAETINKKGAHMVSLSENIDTTGATGRMIFSLLAILAQFERDQIAERTKLALDYLKDNNMVYSNTPYGFNQKDGLLIKSDKEEKIIQEMICLYKSGYGFRKIATHLNNNSVPSKLGGKWYAKTVKQIIERNIRD